MPDPEGAAVLIEALNDVYGLKVDTKELLNKAEKTKIEGRGSASSKNEKSGRKKRGT